MDLCDFIHRSHLHQHIFHPESNKLTLLKFLQSEDYSKEMKNNSLTDKIFIDSTHRTNLLFMKAHWRQ